MRTQVHACVAGRVARLRSVAPVAPPGRSANGKPRRGGPPEGAPAKAPFATAQQFALVDALAEQKAGCRLGGAR